MGLCLWRGCCTAALPGRAGGTLTPCCSCAGEALRALICFPLFAGMCMLARCRYVSLFAVAGKRRERLHVVCAAALAWLWSGSLHVLSCMVPCGFEQCHAVCCLNPFLLYACSTHGLNCTHLSVFGAHLPMPAKAGHARMDLRSAEATWHSVAVRLAAGPCYLYCHGPGCEHLLHVRDMRRCVRTSCKSSRHSVG